MKIAKIVAALGVLVMAGGIIFAFIKGDFTGEGSILLSMPWGIVSMIDLYTGFILFSGWIIYREKSFWRSAFWVVLMMVLGFLTASVYALIALMTCGNDWKKFWLGKNSPG